MTLEGLEQIRTYKNDDKRVWTVTLAYKLFNAYTFHEWPRQNFSLQYQYNIKQTSDENKEKS